MLPLFLPSDLKKLTSHALLSITQSHKQTVSRFFFLVIFSYLTHGSLHCLRLSHSFNLLLSLNKAFKKAEMAWVYIVIPGSHAILTTINNAFFPSVTNANLWIETLIVLCFPAVLIEESVQLGTSAGLSGCSGQTGMTDVKVQSEEETLETQTCFEYWVNRMMIIRSHLHKWWKSPNQPSDKISSDF